MKIHFFIQVLFFQNNHHIFIGKKSFIICIAADSRFQKCYKAEKIYIHENIIKKPIEKIGRLMKIHNLPE